mgnify:CR=1 FL=1
MTDRSQCVVAEAGFTDSRTPNIDSPQGGVVSCVALSLFLNSRHADHRLRLEYHLVEYADDTILLKLHSSTAQSSTLLSVPT